MEKEERDFLVKVKQQSQSAKSHRMKNIMVLKMLKNGERGGKDSVGARLCAQGSVVPVQEVPILVLMAELPLASFLLHPSLVMKGICSTQKTKHKNQKTISKIQRL